MAIQKNSDGYSHSHGFKWSLKNLRAYIEGTRGLEAAEKLMEDIGWLIVHSLKAVQVPNIRRPPPPRREAAQIARRSLPTPRALCAAERDDPRQALLRVLRLRRDDRHGAQAVAARGARAPRRGARRAHTSLTQPAPPAVGQRLAVAHGRHAGGLRA